MEVSLLLYRFKAHYFSLLGYSELVSILSIIGFDAMERDPKLIYDIFKEQLKQKEQNAKTDG